HAADRNLPRLRDNHDAAAEFGRACDASDAEDAGAVRSFVAWAEFCGEISPVRRSFATGVRGPSGIYGRSGFSERTGRRPACGRLHSETPLEHRPEKSFTK